MNVLRGIPEEKGLFGNPVVTLGSFDGVHLGHRRIFSTLLTIARRKGGEAIVITFADHPRRVLTPLTPPKILTTTEEKLRAIGMEPALLSGESFVRFVQTEHERWGGHVRTAGIQAE